MRTFDERNRDVQQKLRKKICRRRAIYAAVSVVSVLALALVLFVPFSTAAPSVAQYSGSPYYSLICKINDYTFTPPTYANRFEMAVAAVQNAVEEISDEWSAEGVASGDLAAAPVAVNDGEYDGYVEVTDNQVAGVIEGDIFKRSDRYIFHLTEDCLTVYSIAQEDSQAVGSYTWGKEGDWNYYWSGDREMYLSEDCTTVTLLLSGSSKERGSQLLLLTLDVRDPANISEMGRVLLDGSYVSSRLVDGRLLVMSQYRCYDPDLSEPESFVPAVYTAEGTQLVDAEDIYAPDTLTSLRYTVLAMLDQKSLEIVDTAAFLSYSEELYVSGSYLFATRVYSESQELEEGQTGIARTTRTMTEVACLAYDSEGFVDCGSVTVEGSVQNQYSMDEQDGVLRIVTSTSSTIVRYESSDAVSVVTSTGLSNNVNLSCYSIGDWTLLAQVTGFAPEGEQAMSVRFDGDTLYVCTAELITVTDPVYFFDLSDYGNITWTDTGTIDGYSASLVNFGEDTLLGIGYSEDWLMKIEVYEQAGDSVESVCSYVRNVTFTEEYKAYFLDREERLIGLPIVDYEEYKNGYGEYLLLYYDGYQLREVLRVPLGVASYDLADVRATVIDGWLYVLADTLYVQEIK